MTVRHFTDLPGAPRYFISSKRKPGLKNRLGTRLERSEEIRGAK